MRWWEGCWVDFRVYFRGFIRDAPIYVICWAIAILLVVHASSGNICSFLGSLVMG